MSGSREFAPNSQPGTQIRITQPVLLVEDSDSIATLFSTALENRWGCEVHRARTYAEAKDYLIRHRKDYHIAICDLNLPDAADGQIIDLTNAAKLKSIVVTGKFGEELKQTMAKKGVVDYVLKQSTNSIEYVVDQVGRLFRNKSIDVLVVDDSPVATDLMTAILETQDFNVCRASNGVQALKLVESNPNIRLVITDYNMPDMNGIELTLRLRRRFENGRLAVIGVSAAGESDLGVQFIKNGANDFLVKPFAHEELVCRISQNLDVLDYIDLINSLANRDDLSQLSNRRHFFKSASTLLEYAVRSNQEVAVAMIDIDFFKKINDTYGHEAGDEVITVVARLVEAHFEDALCARFGGDEFAILMRGVTQDQVAAQLEEFQSALLQANFSFDGNTVEVTPSIGFSIGKQACIDERLRVADAQLYEAKAAGRNCVRGAEITG